MRKNVELLELRNISQQRLSSETMFLFPTLHPVQLYNLVSASRQTTHDANRKWHWSRSNVTTINANRKWRFSRSTSQNVTNRLEGIGLLD